jgi:hypothetical protein
VTPIEWQYSVLKACLQCFVLSMLTLGWKEVEKIGRDSRASPAEQHFKTATQSLLPLDSLKTILRLYLLLRSPHPGGFKRVVLF